MAAAGSIRTLGGRIRASCVIGLILTPTYAVSPDSAVSAQAGAADDVRIEVTMDEYSFTPNPLRIPAGRPVTLVITNAGRRPHEFMAGREAREDQFTQDLFEGLHVNVEEVRPEHGTGGHADHIAAATDAPATDAGHAHAADHGHGTMVENQPGQTFLMSFTLPESRRGEWNMGCFLPGHYEAGMHGTVIVE